MSYKIHLQNVSRIKKIPTKNQFKTWIISALNSRINQAEITVRIVDEEESAQLNQQYRQKQGATNILSFPYKQLAINKKPTTLIEHQENTCLIGDLVICAPVVMQEATMQHKEVESHWAHLIVHGALHLLGHDHIKEDQATIMENLEIHILHSLGINNPYQFIENSSAEQINEK